MPRLWLKDMVEINSDLPYRLERLLTLNRCKDAVRDRLERLVKLSRFQDALRDGLERLVTLNRCQDALRRVTTLVVVPLALVTVQVPYAHLVGRILTIDDHHLVVLAVVVLLALAEIGLVVDGVS